MQSDSIVHHYWNTLGGFKAIVTNSTFWFAVVITLLLFPNWISGDWWSEAITIMPSVLGFSLGGFALWVAIGDDTFKREISGKDPSGDESPFMVVNATFAHFIVLQLLSVFLSLIGKAHYAAVDKFMPSTQIGDFYVNLYALIFAFVGYGVFIYALCTAISVIFAIYRVTSWYDDMVTTIKEKQAKAKKEQDAQRR